MDQVVFPALRAIGTDWELGHIDAAREHAASETIRRRIAHYFDAAGGGDGDAMSWSVFRPAATTSSARSRSRSPPDGQV